MENELNNTIEVKKNNFLSTTLGKIINNAFDTGLKILLPDLIEEQVIDVKNALLNSGLKDGIKTAVDSAIDIGKSAKGILTTNFENTEQIETAIGKGGIIDTISELIETTSNKAYNKGRINKTVNTVITKGKDVLLDSISNNIRKELKDKIDSTEILEKHIDNWKQYYNEKNFKGMEKEYKKIEEQVEKAVPLENVLKETKKLQNIHNLIANNGNNFDLSELEKQMINTFSQ